MTLREGPCLWESVKPPTLQFITQHAHSHYKPELSGFQSTNYYTMGPLSGVFWPTHPTQTTTTANFLAL